MLFIIVTLATYIWRGAMAYPNHWILGGRLWTRALCRIKLLHVLVDTRMLTVKLVYKLSKVPDDLKWAKNTHVTPFTLITNDIYGFGRLIFALFTPSTTRPPVFVPVHTYFYPSIFVFTRPNDGWASLYIMLCFVPNTACLIHRVTRSRAYRGACVGLPNPTFCQRNFSSLKWDQITQSA